MGFKYKNVKKDVFINRHIQLNIIEDHNRFQNKIKKLKSYLVEFDKDNIIKNEMYLFYYIVDSENCQPIIQMTYNKYIFFANNNICKVWTKIKDVFLYSKNQGQNIIISKFLLVFSY